MLINYQTPRVTEPCAYVTKGRQRLKQYGNTVYLNNRDEFEIELYNPTTSKVLAEITLNGKLWVVDLELSCVRAKEYFWKDT